MKIDQDILCDFCENHFNRGTNWRSVCEGTKCKEVRELYLEDVGITDTSNNSPSFSKLRIGDEFYFLDKTKMTINTHKVNAIYALESLQVSENKVTIESNGCNFKVNKNDLGNNKTYTGIYLDLSECKRELKKLCVEKIIELSEIIGSLPKN